MDELNRFRLINKIEGYSYLLLLFVAMPLKYLGGFALATKIAGSIHGLLFVLFCYQLFMVYSKGFISKKEASFYFLLSLVPFGSFYIDKI
ncbi:MAG: hypothetical protein C6H99_06410, partial [Epsilonproteobacteria bacterium]|nr:hypothetical protein [Campylobacterota bacterium]NPA64924.1 DUF3817 domain-containing protein [Campylobacterota bacterium]